MTILWRRAFRYSQTYFLLVGAGLGYLTLLVFTGFKPISFLMGGVIAVTMVVGWFWQFRRAQVPTTGNMLDRDLFLARLDAIATKAIKAGNSPEWREAYQWAEASHGAAIQIAARDPMLMPDLVETLVTVEALTDQVASGYEALTQVQTDTYRNLTQQHLSESRDRLRDTHNQLQQLRDQVVLSQLTQEASADNGSLPSRLQVLIDANKTALHPPEEPPS
ncbi:MAG: hypothetical protein AAFY67_12230 [Cyanobacteria bacterium J06642_9]